MMPSKRILSSWAGAETFCQQTGEWLSC